MNTKSMTHEQISAFADSESGDASDEVVLAVLACQDGRDVWGIYHQIGDILRSDEMAFAMSPDFAARMSARLDLEHNIVAPGLAQARREKNASIAGNSLSGLRRLVMPGAVAAMAVATAAFFAVPQVMLTLDKETHSSITAAVGSVPGVVSVKASDGVIFRDPKIDGYLLAHQRFSPSLYSTAQYARSATFSNDFNK